MKCVTDAEAAAAGAARCSLAARFEHIDHWRLSIGGDRHGPDLVA